MAKKLSSGVMVALIAILSLFGSVDTSFAATAVGGSSQSKYFYAEPDEFLAFDYVDPTVQTSQQYWAAVDYAISNTYNSQYDYHHVFVRRLLFKDGTYIRGEDSHLIMRVSNKDYPNAEPIRADGRIFFDQANGTRVPYEYLRNTSTKFTGEWLSVAGGTSGQGYPLYQTAEIGDVTVFEKFNIDTRYDPYNPPAYAHPDLSKPDPGKDITKPLPSGDPDFPVQPTPPDNNWDLIGWLKYLVEWLIYIVKCFVYFLKSFGSAIGDVVTGSASLISAMTDFFAFLPNQVTTIIGMGILAMIIVGIVKR